jgi:hypothetical protein
MKLWEGVCIMIQQRYRKKVLLLALWTLFFGNMIFGETVLVSSTYPEGKEFGKEQVSWCESGAMEYLFEKGHIVFSTSPNETSYHDSFEGASMRIAKNSGARYLLELNMFFSTALPDKNDPEKTVYRFYDVSVEKELSSGTFSFEAMSEEPAEKQAERLIQAGMDIASRATEGL